MSRRASAQISTVVAPKSAPMVLPSDRLEMVEAWGQASRSASWVYRPTTTEQVAKVFDIARKTGRKVGMKGSGCSYGDAFQNAEGIVLDMSRMNRILDWNPETGRIVVQPGLRIAELWRYTIEDGWWPPVVSGTMFTSMGGCASMNIHGKNAWHVGPFGEHILEFELMTPAGEILRVTEATHPDLFRAAISGFGMLGVFVSLTIQMKKVYSGNLRVIPQRVRNFEETFDAFEANADKMDYMVGWNDCFPSSRSESGRGELHFAQHLEPGEDARPQQSLRVVNQELPDLILGLFPKSALWIGMTPFVNNVGMKLINTAKYSAQFKPGADKPHLQSHAGFAFLLDYVPNWKKAYLPGGLIQHQSFMPKDSALSILREITRLTHRRNVVPYLGVTKKHRTDRFLITHGVDGYSIALDFKVTAENRARLWRTCQDIDQIVTEAGGRHYFAKDLTMKSGTPNRYLAPEDLELFFRLKKQYDPNEVLSTNLYRRIFGPAPAPSAMNSTGKATPQGRPARLSKIA